MVASPARSGPNGGQQGGVALLVPVRFRLLSWRTLVPGCAVEARLLGTAPDSLPFRVQSVYFPPDSRRSALHCYLAGLPQGIAHDDDAYALGDLNLQLFTPPDDRETEDAPALLEG